MTQKSSELKLEDIVNRNDLQGGNSSSQRKILIANSQQESKEFIAQFRRMCDGNVQHESHESQEFTAQVRQKCQ